MKTPRRRGTATGHASQNIGEGKLYAQLAGTIRRRIREKTWQPGDRLPSLDDLALEFGVSLITVRRAVEVLEFEGMLHRVQGRGTFVARTTSARAWLPIATDWNGILRYYEDNKGKLHNEIVDQAAGCTLPAGDDGSPPPNYPFRFMRRLHFVEDIAYGYTDLFLAEHIFERAPKAFTTQMVIKVLATNPGIETGHAYQTVTLGTADRDTAQLLGVSTGSPVGELLRIVHAPSGDVIYRGNVTYRGDLVRIETRLK